MSLPVVSWLTDIHLDHLNEEQVEKFLTAVNDDPSEIVVISGDISVAKRLENHLEDVNYYIRKPTGVVLGNHDFYGGAVKKVQEQMAAIHHWEHVQYLPVEPIFDPEDGWAIVGVDGFADARSGQVDWHRGPVMSDWIYISEILNASADGGREAIPKTYLEIARREADKLQGALADACSLANRILIVTHCPPWAGAAWHEGARSEREFLPWFSSKTIGGTIEMIAQNQPKVKFTVLCGHTHGRGYIRLRENVECFTGCATYGKPELQDWDWATESKL